MTRDQILLCYLNLYDTASPHDWVKYFDSFERFLACRENTHHSIQDLLKASLLGGKVDLGLGPLALARRTISVW